MKEMKIPQDFLKELLEQDVGLDAGGFDELRRQILERLACAEKKERLARWRAAIAGGVALVAALGIQSAVFFVNPEKWPEWVVILAALTIILLIVMAFLLTSIYVFRYRRPLTRLRKDAREQTLIGYFRQIDDLRKSLDELRKERE